MVPHLTHEETEAWGGKVTCWGHASQQYLVKAGLEAWSAGSASPTTLAATSHPLTASLFSSSAEYHCFTSKGWVYQSGGGRESCWKRCTTSVSWHFFLTRAWKQDSQSQGSVKVPNKLAQRQTWGEWAMACDSEGVSGCGERRIGHSTKKVHASWDATEPSCSVPMCYHQFNASPAVFLETQNGFVCT